MRPWAATLAFAALALPAAAADTIADQAQSAYRLYAGSLSQDAFMAAGYGSTLFGGIAGRWVRLNGPNPKTGIETYGSDTDKFCKSAAALTLSSSSPLSFEVTATLGGASFTQTYTLIAGSTFAEHVDPAQYFAAVGLGPDKRGASFDQQRAFLLSLANGVVQIYRPSDDILVMTRDRSYPTVMARCPAGTAAN